MAAHTLETTPAALHKGPIHWLTWGEDAFRRAAAEDRLLLVDVGAVWCHWCHVMDRTTYDNPDVARLINERFIPVRVDRDQRPDIDLRLQRAAPMVQSQGNGWPLTVVLTPAGHVLFKATYVPPTADTSLGAGMGMVEMLEQLDELYHQRRDELDKAGPQVDAKLESYLNQAVRQPGEVDAAATSRVLAGVSRHFDPQFGGFDGQPGRPKFAHSAAIDLCLLQAARTDDSYTRRIGLDTLDALAKGGIRDHLGGGFHRYSTDPYWKVPHFEKMAGDNGSLLGNFARAFALSGEDSYRRVVLDILRFTEEVLYDHERGGFHGSQDADMGLADDGGYFTWTLDEVKAVLNGPELEAIVHHFDITEVGDMPDAPDRSVLHVSKTTDQLGKLMKVSPEELARRIESGKAKLLAARSRRPTPWIDRTVFVDWNGLYIRAVADAWRLMELDDRWLELAVRAADRLLEQAVDKEGRLAHFLPLSGPQAHGATECKVFGQLADHANFAWGLLGLYSITGTERYLSAAGNLLDYIVNHLQDREHGGFFDSAGPADDTALLRYRQKSWEDSPTQSANSIACMALLEASVYAERSDFAEAARRALEGFAGAVTPETGLFVAGWALAADYLLNPPAHVKVFSDPAERLPMLRAAWSAAPLGCVLTQPLQPAGEASGRKAASTKSAANVESASLKTAAPPEATAGPMAIVCAKGSCRPPVQSAEELKELLKSLT